MTRNVQIVHTATFSGTAEFRLSGIKDSKEYAELLRKVQKLLDRHNAK